MRIVQNHSAASIATSYAEYSHFSFYSQNTARLHALNKIISYNFTPISPLKRREARIRAALPSAKG
jgi:hypothetical protein